MLHKEFKYVTELNNVNGSDLPVIFYVSDADYVLRDCMFCRTGLDVEENCRGGVNFLLLISCSCTNFSAWGIKFHTYFPQLETFMRLLVSSLDFRGNGTIHILESNFQILLHATCLRRDTAETKSRNNYPGNWCCITCFNFH